MNVLFVCLGNICRSPTVEAVARTLATREAPQLGLRFDSAGTADYHTGDPPDRRSIEAAARRGYDLAPLRARQLQRADFTRFDLLLAMDAQNLEDMLRIAPREERHRASLFLASLDDPACVEVPDPYYGGPAGFDAVLDLAEAGSRALFVAIGAKGTAGRSHR